jgi:hypothetical protein
VQAHWQANGRAERLVLSFHGVPHRTLMLGDPYHCQCRKTARLLGERLGLSGDQLLVTFQSRFGRARWLEPYTEPTLRELAAQGVKRVDVMCPGFVADCLETLEEIAMEARDAFLESGGAEFRYKGINADGTVGTLVQRQDGAGSVVGNRVSTSKVLSLPQYADQIMPFSIVVYAANEYGHSARMKIHNVEIMNAGSGMSIDDITTDESCTFVATDIEPWSDQMYVGADGSVVQLSETQYEPGQS